MEFRMSNDELFRFTYWTAVFVKPTWSMKSTEFWDLMAPLPELAESMST